MKYELPCEPSNRTTRPVLELDLAEESLLFVTLDLANPRVITSSSCPSAADSSERKTKRGVKFTHRMCHTDIENNIQNDEPEWRSQHIIIRRERPRFLINCYMVFSAFSIN